MNGNEIRDTERGEAEGRQEDGESSAYGRERAGEWRQPGYLVSGNIPCLVFTLWGVDVDTFIQGVGYSGWYWTSDYAFYGAPV